MYLGSVGTTLIGSCHDNVETLSVSSGLQSQSSPLSETDVTPASTISPPRGTCAITKSKLTWDWVLDSAMKEESYRQKIN